MGKNRQKKLVILAFEASTDYLSAALLADDSVLAMKKVKSEFGQAAKLMPLAVEVLATAQMEFSELSHVAAGCGPGSFTGIRVALATAKGVCIALTLPGLGISGLEALAFSCAQYRHGLPILSVADTRRDNVYFQLFDSDMTQIGKIFETQIEKLPFLVPKSICSDGLAITGYDWAKVEQVFAAEGIEVKSTPPPIDDFCDDQKNAGVDAVMIAKLAANKIRSGTFSPLSPLYLANPRLGTEKKRSSNDPSNEAY